MIMLTVTKPKRKLRRILKGVGLLLLLVAVVPGLYYTLSSVGAMSMFASGTVQDSGQSLANAPDGENGNAGPGDSGQAAAGDDVQDNSEAKAESADDGEKADNNEAVNNEKASSDNIDENNGDNNIEENKQDSPQKAADNKMTDSKTTDGAMTEEPPADEAPAEKAEDKEKSGLGQALREVIFGRKPEVHIYQNLG